MSAMYCCAALRRKNKKHGMAFAIPCFYHFFRLRGRSISISTRLNSINTMPT